MWRRIGSNSLANLSTGVSGTLFQIGLTAIASRSFDPSLFSIWALALSMASLVPLFSANLSTVITRRLMESSSERAGAILQSGQRLAGHLSLGAVTVIGLASLLLQQHSVPLQAMAVGPLLLLVLLLVTAQLWIVLLQPQFGWQYAREDNWKVARVISSARIGGLIGLGFACVLFAKEGLLAAALGLLVGSFFGLVVAGVQRGSANSAATLAVSEETASMLPLLKAFAVWSAGSAAIQYGLPPFISLLAPKDFNAFYLAYILNLILVGTIGAAASALLAPLTRQRLAGATVALEHLLALAPLAIGLLLVLLILLVWYALPQILPMWSSHMATADDVRRPLFWLALQTIARSMTLVHSVLLSSAGRPGQMSRPIVLEIILAIFVALPIGWLFGAIALLATLSIAGLLTALYTVWITLSLGVSRTTSRNFLSLAFVAAQTLTLGLWTFASQ